MGSPCSPKTIPVTSPSSHLLPTPMPIFAHRRHRPMAIEIEIEIARLTTATGISVGWIKQELETSLPCLEEYRVSDQD